VVAHQVLGVSLHRVEKGLHHPVTGQVPQAHGDVEAIGPRPAVGSLHQPGDGGLTVPDQSRDGPAGVVREAFPLL